MVKCLIFRIQFYSACHGNDDDASGLRLDTSSNMLYQLSQAIVFLPHILTMSLKYPNVLQTTSSHFSKTGKCDEVTCMQYYNYILWIIYFRKWLFVRSQKPTFTAICPFALLDAILTLCELKMADNQTLMCYLLLLVMKIIFVQRM